MSDGYFNVIEKKKLLFEPSFFWNEKRKKKGDGRGERGEWEKKQQQWLQKQ